MKFWPGAGAGGQGETRERGRPIRVCRWQVSLARELIFIHKACLSYEGRQGETSTPACQKHGFIKALIGFSHVYIPEILRNTFLIHFCLYSWSGSWCWNRGEAYIPKAGGGGAGGWGASDWLPRCSSWVTRRSRPPRCLPHTAEQGREITFQGSVTSSPTAIRLSWALPFGVLGLQNLRNNLTKVLRNNLHTSVTAHFEY